MPYLHMRKKYIRPVLIIVLILGILGGILSGVMLWDVNRKQQAVQYQEQIDEAARRRREGWIEKNGSWYMPKPGLETVLLIGIDKKEPIEDSGSYNNNAQSDFLLLALFNHAEKTTSFLHLNRDTMTEIPVLGVTGEEAGSVTGQLALAHTYGSGLHDSSRNTVKAVSGLLGKIRIDRYITLSMGAVPLLNDLVGGVTVTLDEDFTSADASMAKGKTVRLHGNQAMLYVGARGGMEDSSNLNRMRRQRKYMEALTGQMQELGDDYEVPSAAIQELSPYMLFSCTVNELHDLSDRTSEYTLTGFQDIAGEAVQGKEFMEFYPDAAALEKQVLELFYDPAEDMNS